MKNGSSLDLFQRQSIPCETRWEKILASSLFQMRGGGGIAIAIRTLLRISIIKTTNRNVAGMNGFNFASIAIFNYWISWFEKLHIRTHKHAKTDHFFSPNEVLVIFFTVRLLPTARWCTSGLASFKANNNILATELNRGKSGKFEFSIRGSYILCIFKLRKLENASHDAEQTMINERKLRGYTRTRVFVYGLKRKRQIASVLGLSLIHISEPTRPY